MTAWKEGIVKKDVAANLTNEEGKHRGHHEGRREESSGQFDAEAGRGNIGTKRRDMTPSI
jgi:ribosomal protein L15